MYISASLCLSFLHHAPAFLFLRNIFSGRFPPQVLFFFFRRGTLRLIKSQAMKLIHENVETRRNVRDTFLMLRQILFKLIYFFILFASLILI